MKRSRLLAGMIAAIAMMACDGHHSTPDDNKQDNEPETGKVVFAEGADISWATQMEKDGVRFYNAQGKETECTALMKEIGFDAVRLRVWVDPEEGWCGKEDVLVKAKRAQALGMRIMIDFHYSNSWADPGKQDIPAAWKDYDISQLTAAVGAHTDEVLKSLKDNDIDVEWVQIGNEVNNGMLWPHGKVQGNAAGQFISFINSGYSMVKANYPSAKVIIHVSNGHDSGLFSWFFNLMALGNARYDIIGMSLYPLWWENGGWNDWKVNADKCLANIRSMNETYGKPVMLCEIGMPVSEPQMSAEAIRYILGQTRNIEDCHGVFYWEPQTDGVWKPSNYDALGWGPYNMGAFKNGRPTAALDPFKN